ncbi:MAG: biliverdin-producing heme oxygenase [Acidimicrobiia bacterium]|nr:biliverdin-producing heme oxygenase [Acidimicrobiia bacterium]
MSAPVDAPEAGFSAALRAATTDDHRTAERDGFLVGLMRGSLPIDAYVDFARQLWFVYDTLENAARARRSDPAVGAFVDAALERRPAIEADLAVLDGPDWRDALVARPATTAYVERLRWVASAWSGNLVAHHYTRYLGDLSGGVHIGRALARAYGLDETSGLSFYRFDRIDDPVAYKEHYRARLDTMPWTDTERDHVTEEVRRAYGLNTALLAELAAAWVPAGDVDAERPGERDQPHRG